MAQKLLMASADERARLALEAGKMGSWVCSLTRDVAAGDERVCQLFGVPPSDELRPTAEFLERIHPDDLPQVQAAIARSRGGEEDYYQEFRVRHGDHWCWLAGRGKLSTMGDNDVVLTGVNWDITHRKEEEERLEILAKEMDHRVKNAFSVMNALVRLGSRSATSISSFTDTLVAQLRAMADAHRMSSETARIDHGDSACIAQVVRMAVAPWLTGNAERVSIDEQVHAKLPLGKVSAFAMLTYELATNAAKYGALSCPEGRLVITVGRTAEGNTLFCWDETADHSIIRKAAEEEAKGSETGFGTTLLNHCAATLQARLKREMRPQGLLVEMRFPAEVG